MNALQHLADVNGLPLSSLQDAAFALRAEVWRRCRRVPTEAEVLDALRLGIAASLTAATATTKGPPR